MSTYTIDVQDTIQPKCYETTRGLETPADTLQYIAGRKDLLEIIDSGMWSAQTISGVIGNSATPAFMTVFRVCLRMYNQGVAISEGAR